MILELREAYECILKYNEETMFISISFSIERNDFKTHCLVLRNVAEYLQELYSQTYHYN